MWENCDRTRNPGKARVRENWDTKLQAGTRKATCMVQSSFVEAKQRFVPARHFLLDCLLAVGYTDGNTSGKKLMSDAVLPTGFQVTGPSCGLMDTATSCTSFVI